MSTYSIFDAYLAQNYKDISEGKEIICEVLSLDEGVTKIVKARIASTEQELKDADELLVKRDTGEWKGEKWFIKISEELDPDETVLAIAPISATSSGYGAAK